MSVVRRAWLALAALPLVLPVPDVPAQDERTYASFTMGDFDGDGIPDIAAGFPMLARGSLKEAGEIRIYSGKTGGLIRRIHGRTKGEHRGRGISAVGDWNRDGMTDLASAIDSEVTDPKRPGDRSTVLRAEVLSGRTGSTIQAYSLPDVGYNGSLSADLCVLGDGSGRERSDFVIQASWLWYYVDSSKKTVGAPISEETHSDRITHYVGDVDGDGAGDFAIGAYMEKALGISGAGRMRVVSGEHSEMAHRSQISWSCRESPSMSPWDGVSGPPGTGMEMARGTFSVEMIAGRPQAMTTAASCEC